MKRAVLAVFCVGLLAPIHAGQAGNPPSSSWWKTYLPTLRMPSMPSWVGMPTPERRAHIKDQLRYGLLTGTAMLSGGLASLIIASKLDVSNVGKGSALVGGALLGGLLARYLGYRGDEEFNDLKNRVEAIERLSIKSVTYDELNDYVNAIKDLVPLLRSYEARSSLEEKLWLQEKRISLMKLSSLASEFKKIETGEEEKNYRLSLRNKILSDPVYHFIMSIIRLERFIPLSLAQNPNNSLIEKKNQFEKKLNLFVPGIGDKDQEILMKAANFISKAEDYFAEIKAVYREKIPASAFAAQFGFFNVELNQIKSNLEKVSSSNNTINQIINDWAEKLRKTIQEEFDKAQAEYEKRLAEEESKPGSPVGKLDEAPPAREQLMPQGEAIQALKEAFDFTQETLTQDAINKAYKTLALKYHPDKYGGDEAMFVKINSAKKSLSVYLEQKDSLVQSEYKKAKEEDQKKK